MSENFKEFLLKVGVIVLICFLAFEYFKYRNVSSEQISDINNLAKHDTIRVETNTNGDKTFEKLSYFNNSLSDLKNNNFELYKSIEGLKGNVLFVQNSLANFKGDTLKSKDSMISKDSLVEINWNFDTASVENKWSRNLSGKTVFVNGKNKVKLLGSTLFKDENKYKISTGFKESEKYPGHIEIFMNSSSPYFSTSDIEGSIVKPDELAKLLPTKKSYAIGYTASLGLGTTYNGVNTYIGPTFSIGIGFMKIIKIVK